MLLVDILRGLFSNFPGPFLPNKERKNVDQMPYPEGQLFYIGVKFIRPELLVVVRMHVSRDYCVWFNL